MSGAVPGINFETLTPWFRDHVAPVDSIEAAIIGHGRSNLTYRIESGGQKWVLRRPPLSHVLPTAHDMKREFRVLSALWPTGFPAPRPIALCEDVSVNGAPFYVMEHVDGFVPALADEVAKRFDEDQRRRIGEELIDVLVRLHSLNPADVGLEDFGRPQGFIARQVRRFGEQLERSRTRPVPELDELQRRLSSAVPPEGDASIVHGDYRLDNAMLDGQGHIIAVLDWEMATLGDPLADVGMLMMYWAGPGEGAMPVVASNAVTALPGFPTRDEAIARYAEKSGRDLSQLDFYRVLAYFKLAVILEGIHARYLEGGTVGAGFEMIGDQVFVLARGGLAVADASPVPGLRG